MVKKDLLTAFIGVIGGVLTQLIGGWDMAAQTLILFMTTDYITGMVVAGVFHKSNKSENGTLESRAGFKGLFRKGIILCMVFVAQRLDMMFETQVIRNAVIIGYICNEALSIVENAGLMGVPIPQVILDSIEVLKKNDGNKEHDFR